MIFQIKFSIMINILYLFNHTITDTVIEDFISHYYFYMSSNSFITDRRQMQRTVCRTCASDVDGAEDRTDVKT